MSVMQVTKNGFIKSAKQEDFSPHARGGKGVIGLAVNEKTGDVVSVLDVVPGCTILVATAKGLCARFSTDEVRDTYRGGTGVKAINLNEGDSVVGAVTLP